MPPARPRRNPPAGAGWPIGAGVGAVRGCVEGCGLAEGAGARYVRLGLEKLREPRLPELKPPPARAHASSGTKVAKSAAKTASPTSRVIHLSIPCSSWK
jgi:hypothetical protein